MYMHSLLINYVVGSRVHMEWAASGSGDSGLGPVSIKSQCLGIFVGVGRLGMLNEPKLTHTVCVI